MAGCYSERRTQARSQSQKHGVSSKGAGERADRTADARGGGAGS